MSAEEVDNHECLKLLKIPSFEQRIPWIGGDLQTLRDTFAYEKLPVDRGKPIHIAVPSLTDREDANYLLALLDLPIGASRIKGVVLLLHGLGGSSRRKGLRRMCSALQDAGFAVLRLNLRGAKPGRHLAPGTYSAKCNSDLIPVLIKARKLCEEIGSNKMLPLFGVGLSLGGTMLLNACMSSSEEGYENMGPFLDGLVCISTPLDLLACSISIEKPRNGFYQSWLLKRLISQTLADPFGITRYEWENLTGESLEKRKPSSIREFDELITAPRWGYSDVDSYYKNASPLCTLIKGYESLPKTLIIQSFDDPWVPSGAAQELRNQTTFSIEKSKVQVLLTSHGGHNGFHGINGCWGDKVATEWLKTLLV